MTLATGARFGSYEIRGLLGTGGMGEVYRARDSKLARDVAIKVLPPELSADARRLQRFEKEARTVSALNHPNVVTVLDIGSVDGTSFIAMELVEGKTLRELLEGGALPLRKLLAIGAQVADGLSRAHASGIVHRDLKPENLMVTRDGFVKILDFGLAKLVGGDFEASRGAGNPTLTWETEAGVVLGTVGYMSPEQATGRPVDFRSDQFSFGSILYEMISGKRAFQRPTAPQTLSAIIDSEPEPLPKSAPGLPMSLAWIVERCLAKDPEDRYGSTKDLARDLALLRDHSSGGSGPGVLPPAGRRVRVSRAAVGGIALAVAGLAALTFLVGQRVQARRDREAPPPSRTPLTFSRGFVTGARFAPDGHTIVYSAAWGGKPSEIFTTRVGSTESRALGIQKAILRAVSTTGEMAILLGCGAGRWNCLGTLARAPLAGGAPREVLDRCSFADWSPDGKELAVIHVVGDGSQIEYPIGNPLARSDPMGYLSSLRVSPDGQRVAYIDHPFRETERGILTVVDRAGRKTTLAGEWATFGPILWSPTGDEVFFSSWVDGETRGTRLSGRMRRASSVLGLDDVSRDHRFLDSGTESGRHRGVVRALLPGAPHERDFSWLNHSVVSDVSKDGQQLLLHEESRSRDRPGEPVYTTFLRDASGGAAKMLGEGRALTLSPDNAWALVARALPEPHLVLLPTGAGEPRRLPGGDLLYRRAEFFPDGRRLIFNADEILGSPRSYIQDLAGGLPTPFGPEGSLSMVVSPDGRSVAGFTERGLVVFPADGGGPPRVILERAGGRPLRWSADGRSIFLVREEEDEESGTEQLVLYRIEVASGRQERWKQLSPPDMAGFVEYGSHLRGSGFAVTPDGRYYAYSYFTDQSQLVLAEGRPDWWK